MNNKTFLYGITLLFLFSLALIGCDNDATGQDGSIRVDFMQNVTSGSVFANTEGSGFVLQLEVSPHTSFIAENPGFEAGIINTDNFFILYSDIFGDSSPNSILALRENGTAISVPIALSNPEYNSTTGTIEFIATPVDQTQTPNFSTMSVQSIPINELESSFGPAFLFIDSGSIDPMGGTCGDGASMVCPIGLGSDPCINKGSGPQCCVLGNGVTCSTCICN